jgi:hypothetical protein
MEISSSWAADTVAPDEPVDDVTINAFVDTLMRRLVKGKRYV